MIRDYKSSPPRLLVVEKDPDFSEFLQESFTDAGYIVQSCHSYTDGLQWVVNRPTDLITTHIQKENPEGYHFIRNVRKCPKRDTPIIVITGSVDKDLVVKLAPLKVTKILVKPLNILAAIQAANEILNFNPPEATHNKAAPEKTPDTATANPDTPESNRKEQNSDEDLDGFELTDEAV